MVTVENEIISRKEVITLADLRQTKKPQRCSTTLW